MAEIGRYGDHTGKFVPEDGTAAVNLVDKDAKAWRVSGTIDVSTSADIEGGGKVAVGVAAVAMTFTGTTKSIILTADLDNTGTLYIGKSNVTSAGLNAITFLLPGESLTMDYDDSTNAIYAVGSTAGQYIWKGALL